MNSCYTSTHMTEVSEISVTENICRFIFSVIAAENPWLCDFLVQLLIYVIPGVGELGPQGARRVGSQPPGGTNGKRGKSWAFW